LKEITKNRTSKLTPAIRPNLQTKAKTKTTTITEAMHKIRVFTPPLLLHLEAFLPRKKLLLRELDQAKLASLCPITTS
jgi:hypothetical protein